MIIYLIYNNININKKGYIINKPTPVLPLYNTPSTSTSRDVPTVLVPSITAINSIRATATTVIISAETVNIPATDNIDVFIINLLLQLSIPFTLPSIVINPSVDTDILIIIICEPAFLVQYLLF